MIWFAAAAAATLQPTVTIDLTLPAIDTVLRSAQGDVLVGDAGYQHIVQGVLTFTPYASPPVGRFQTFYDCDLNQDGVADLVLDDGGLSLLDHTTLVPHWAGSHPPGATTLAGVGCADVDDDGLIEVVALHSAPAPTLAVYDGPGAPSDIVTGPATSSQPRLAIGQLDADPVLEIMLPGGMIVDGGLRAQQHTLPAVGANLHLVDIDQDGIDEVFSWYNGADQLTTATGQVLWRLTQNYFPGDTLAAGDTNGDGVDELYLLQNTLSRAPELWTIDLTTGARTVPISDGVGNCQSLVVAQPLPGQPVLLCITRREPKIFTPDLSPTLMPGGPPGRRGAPGDLDGDGTTEILFVPSTPRFGGEVWAYDATGQVLDHAYHPRASNISMVDREQDGVFEILEGSRQWLWNDAFDAFVPLFSTVGMDCVRYAGDLDNNGYDDLLFDDCSDNPVLQRLDLSNGSVTDIASFSAGPVVVADLDGFGRSEILTRMTTVGPIQVTDIAGNELGRFPGTHLGVVPYAGRTYLLNNTAPHALFGWRQGTYTVLRTITPPYPIDGGMWWRAGRLWFESGLALVGWNPRSGDVDTLPITGTVATIHRTDDMLWVSDDASIRVFPVP